MPIYTCNNCNKSFTHKGHYIKHINRKYPCLISSTQKPQNTTQIPQNTTQLPQNTTQIININEKSKLPCIYCNKLFSRKDSLARHIASFCKTKKQNDANKEKLLIMLADELEEKKNIINDMTSKIDKLEKKCTISNKMNISNNNITNNNNNIAINVVPYGKEDTEKISNREYKQIFQRCMYSVPSFVEKLHFNANIPEHHNVYISNLRADYVLVFNGKQWITMNKNNFIENMFSDKADFLESKFDEMLEQKLIANDDSVLRRFSIFLEAKDTDNEDIRTIKHELKFLLYNNKNLIIDTNNGLISSTPTPPPGK
jgi:uncharacterized C2H2 Zn-finger protein